MTTFDVMLGYNVIAKGEVSEWGADGWCNRCNSMIQMRAIYAHAHSTLEPEMTCIHYTFLKRTCFKVT